MKPSIKFIFILPAIFLTLSGCATFDRSYPEPEKGVCDQPGSEASIICQVCHEMGIEPEQLDGLILESSMVAVIIDENIDKKKALRFIERLELYLETENLTYRMVIQYVENEAQAEALSILLNRRLKNFDLPDVIGSFDMELIRLHLANQRHLLGGVVHR